MKYTDEKIIKLISADLSGESRIRESLKLKLISKKSRSCLYALFAAAAACAVIVFIFTGKEKEEQYVYNQYPMRPVMEISDRYGAAGPRGLTFLETDRGG